MVEQTGCKPKMATGTPWVKRKARVDRACQGFCFAKGCGKKIAAGDFFYQSKYRAGLARAEICVECAEHQDIE